MLIILHTIVSKVFVQTNGQFQPNSTKVFYVIKWDPIFFKIASGNMVG